MTESYVYRTYTATGDLAAVRDRLIGLLEIQGYRLVKENGDEIILAYPKITFSSKKPLTCISKLLISLSRDGGDHLSVRFGTHFKKIKWFTIVSLVFVCGILPAAISYWFHGTIDIPIPAYLGIPIGFFLHYHVRWRVFNALRRLLIQAEAEAAS